MSVYDFHGKTIEHIQIIGPEGDTDFIDGEAVPPCLVIPDDSKLFNFSVNTDPAGKREFLVLDPYGDENYLSETVRIRLIGSNKDQEGITVAIELQTGYIYHALFYFDGESRKLCLGLTAPQPEGNDGPIRLPLPWRKSRCKAIATWLRSCKRPFRWALPPWAMSDFIDREIGYQDLARALILDLSLPSPNGGKRLLLAHGQWATQSYWSAV